MGSKRSNKFFGLIYARPNDKLSGIFVKDNQELIPVYLAGFIDGCSTVSIRAYYQKNNTAYFSPRIDIPNYSIVLSKYLCKKYEYNYNLKKMQNIPISGIKAYCFINEILPYLTRQKVLAKYIVYFGELKKWDSLLNFHKPRETFTVERSIVETKIALSIRLKNKTRSGLKSKELRRLYEYYKSLTGEKFRIINFHDKKNNYSLPEIFMENKESKKFTKKQSVYLAGFLDSKRTLFFTCKGIYDKNIFIPGIKILNKNNNLKKFIARKYGKTFGKKLTYFLYGDEAIDLIRYVYNYLITNKEKADYILDWNNNKGNFKKQFEIIYKSLINYPYEQGNHDICLSILRDYYEDYFKAKLK